MSVVVLDKVFMGVIFSFLVHMALVALAWVGLPQFLLKKTPPPLETLSISVELLPVTSHLNLPPRPEYHTQKPSKEPAKAIEKPKTPPPPPAPPVKEEIVPVKEEKTVKETPPSPPAEVSKPDIHIKDLMEEEIPQPVLKHKEPKKVEEEKEALPAPILKPILAEEKKEEPKPIKKPPRVNDELEALLKNVEKFEEETDAPKGDKTKGGEASPKNKGPLPPHNTLLPLSLSEKAYIQRKLEKNWSISMGNQEVSTLIVELDISLTRDGSVKDIKFVDERRYQQDALYRVAAEQARRAVLKSSPFSELSVENYNQWSEFRFNFDPSKMVR